MTGLLDIFSGADGPSAAMAWLDGSSYDELFEVDIVNNRCANIFHVEGKYHVPVFDSTFTGLYEYAADCMVHPDDREIFENLLDPETLMQRLEESETPGTISAQYRYRLQNGGWRWVETFVFGERFGIAPGVARCYIYDIQNQKDREHGAEAGTHFENESQRDDKTGLYWEKEFLARASALRESVNSHEWCLVVIDLDHFKLFNDWYGRDAGDLLLARVGKQLQAVEEETGGVAGYFGQDDYCIMMPYDQRGVIDLHEKIDELFSGLTNVLGFKSIFGVSALDDEAPMLDLFDRAKIALGNAKKTLKTDISVFNTRMKAISEREYQVLLDFHHGLTNREFKVFLQPQCFVATGKIIGAEALVRWIRSDGTVVSPAEFIPVLEKHGFMADLDRYVWEEVCIGLRSWLDAGRDIVPVSVNVSQTDFYSMDVADCLEELVEKYNFPAPLLKIEITESAFASSAAVVEDVTARLRDKGFPVLMDDFGSGYSSLNALSTLDVDTIKLDAAFFRMGDEGKRKSIRIVESIVSMARNMGLPIICEGVETQEQVDFLNNLGCRYIQGFYYFRPMPVEDFLQLAENGMLDDRGFAASVNYEMGIRELLDQNIYSDSMLNNILGPVAFYLWREDGRLDIVRYNEQFYKAVGTPQFHDRLVGIDKMLAPEDRPRIFELMSRAEDDALNGAGGTLRFWEEGGVTMRFMLHFYYLGNSGEGKLFFASVRNVTEQVESQINMEILANFISSSVVFVRRQFDKWRFKVIIHGLREVTGMSVEEFQAELDDRSFYDRFEPDELEEIKKMVKESLREDGGFAKDFKMKDGSGKFAPFTLMVDHVPDETDGVAYILVVRQAF